MGQVMLDVIEDAPQCCCITQIGAPVGHQLNTNWCSQVNAELLHPAGYTCDVHHWVTKGDNGQDVDHLAIIINDTQVPQLFGI